MSWERMGDGHYARKSKMKIDEKDRVFLGVVLQHGELWLSRVLVDGKLVDQGEWDGRRTAFRNARAAMKRAMQLRNVESFTRDDEEEEHDCY